MTEPADTPAPSLTSPGRKTVIIPRELVDESTANYDIMEKIAAGGMGVVYLARDRRLGRFVALKRLGREFWAHTVMRERFLREAKSIAALNHANIVHVYSLTQDREGPYIAMEYVAGPDASDRDGLPPPPLTLEARIARDGTMEVSEAISMMIKLCSALRYAHERGVIHRDLKPSNVLLTESEEPKVVDFGLARQHDSDDDLTVTGTKMVSLGYSAPEQELDASSVDQRADVYSLGGILYFCLTGENPRFFRENRIPEPLRPSILKAIESDVTKRWESVESFEEALFHTGIITPEVAERGTWWCKWCHAINPLARRFCVDCGWDGLEHCGECNAETRIGVQYCGNCGTDAKSFEETFRIYERLQVYDKEHKYHLLREEAQQAYYQAKGDHGRRLVSDIQNLQMKADLALQRREELMSVVPAEYKKGNYERVRALLKELDRLNATDTFAELRREIPVRIANRDLTRALTAWNLGNLDESEALCQAVIETPDVEQPEAEQLLKRIVRRRQVERLRVQLLGLACIVILYTVSAFPVLSWTQTTAHPGDTIARAAYAPIHWCARVPVVGHVLNWVADKWDITLDETDSMPPGD